MIQQDTKIPFNRKFQACLVVQLITDYDFFRNVNDDLMPDHLESNAHIKLLKIVKSIYKLLKRPITVDIIKNQLLKIEQDGIYSEAEVSGIYDVIHEGITCSPIEVEVVKRDAFDFLRKQTIARAVSDSLPHLEAGHIDTVYKTISDAYKKTYGIGESIGYNYIEASVTDRYSEPPRAGVWTTGYPKLDGYLDGGFAQSECYSVISPTGRGKCHGKNTLVLLADGTTDYVQNIAVGDVLMGPDGKGRNDVHLLSLKMTGGSDGIKLSDGSRIAKNTEGPIFVEAENFYNSNKTAKHCLKGWYPEATTFEVESTDHPIPPYILGVWLGDGSSDSPEITKPFGAVSQAFEDYARIIGCRTVDISSKSSSCPTWNLSKDTAKTNALTDGLRSLSVLNNKHVPNQYKMTTQEARLELLAGLLDTDGSLHYGGYDIIQKSESIAKDIEFIAKSLGFAVNISKCQKGIKSTGFVGDYWRVTISGDCDRIPVKDPAKKAEPRLQKKNHLLTGLTIEPAGYGDYYGFEIDGDRQYLLGDWQVTHNTALLCNFSITAQKNSKNVLFVPLEMTDVGMAQRQDSILCGFSNSEIALNRDYQFILEQEIAKLHGHCFVKPFARGQLSMAAFRNYLDRFCNEVWKPDVIVLDWLGCLKLPYSKEAKKHELLADVADDFINLTRDYSCTGITAHQSNRSAVSQDIFDYSSVSESFASLFGMDCVFGLGATNEAKDAGKRTLSILKNRFGPDSVYVKLMGDLPGKPLTFKFEEMSEDEEEIKNLLGEQP